MVLDFIAEHSEAVSGAEVGRALNLPKSSVHGLCTTLTEMRLLVRDSESRYRIGPQALVLAQSYLASIDPQRDFEAEVRKIPILADESLVLAVLDGVEVMYAATHPGRQPIALSYKVGLRLPATCTSSGKALLSSLPEAEVARMFKGRRFRVMTPNSVPDLAALQEELTLARKLGYATDDEGTAQGMYCVGAPITGAMGQPLAAVSVTTVKASLNEKKIAALTQSIRQLAHALSV